MTSKFNFKLAKEHLINISTNKIFIFPNILYPNSTIQKLFLLKNQFKDYYSKIIEYPKDKQSLFLLEVKCPGCLNIRQLSVSRVKFITILNHLDNILISGCSFCKRKPLEEKRKRRKEEEEERKNKWALKEQAYDLRWQQDKSENIQKYLENFLDPEKKWPPKISSYQKIQHLLNSIAKEKEVIDYIKNMPYQQFLQTPYWLAISEHKRKKANFQCELCPSKNRLNTHHKTYEIRGEEIFNLHQLIVLCNNCHSKFHNINIEDN